jgi:hypothetical protein
MDWDEDQLRRISEEMLVDPDVLDAVIGAYNALLRGDRGGFRNGLRAAEWHAVLSLLPVPAGHVSLCRSHCQQEIADHYGMDYAECVIWLGRIERGTEPGPLEDE